MKKPVKIVLISIVVLGVAGLSAGLFLFNKKHSDLNKVKPDFKVEASIIQKEFEENEATATSKYLNKIIEVSGQVQSVKQGDGFASSINLKTGSEMSSVICTFSSSDDISGLAVGRDITVRGECSGFLMDVLLNNCVIVK